MRVTARTTCVFILLTLQAGSGSTQEPFSDRVVYYDMSASLDVRQKQLDAHTELTWINPSDDTVGTLQFHLYLNAFRNSASTWMREGEQFLEFFGKQWFDDCGWGWVSIDEMYDRAGRDLTNGFQFLQPEDGNPEDRTVLQVQLIDPVLPRDTLRISFNWTSRIPNAMVRTGYNRDFYFLAQWFPKLGVYEPAGMRYATTGGWNCHQYHANSEYYADFGTYDVQLTVPEDFIVGASGILVSTEPADPGMRSLTFRAEDVIDFTWSASPQFKVLDTDWKDTRIALMIYPEHEQFASRFMEPLEFALACLDTRLGDYPYPNLTVIAAPIHGIFAGAMEYPTLITAFATALLPKGFRSTETLVVHEFIHQYFMQMVATNEQEEAWMDEGITSYYEAIILDSLYGDHTSLIDFAGFCVGNFENARHEFFRSGFATSAPASLATWEFQPRANDVISYDKTALWLKTLEGLVGEEVMGDAMRAYFERWKFRHPCAQDFRDVINEVVIARLHERWPEGMDWYFDQVINGTELCDYRVLSVTSRIVDPVYGYRDDLEDCIVPTKPGYQGQPSYRSKVIFQRLGGLKIPIQMRCTFKDGSTEEMTWNGQSGSKAVTFTRPSQLIKVEIDPEFKNRMDLDIINNSWTADVQHKGLRWYLTRSLAHVQHLMEGLTLFM